MSSLSFATMDQEWSRYVYDLIIYICGFYNILARNIDIDLSLKMPIIVCSTCFVLGSMMYSVGFTVSRC